MTTENQQLDKSKISSTNVDSPGQMRGWFKLIETIRKTDPPSTPSNESARPSTNSNVAVSTNTYIHISKSPRIIDDNDFLSTSPNEVSSSVTIKTPPTPVQSFETTPLVDIEPVIKKKESKHSTVRRKKITIRKSTKSKEFSTNNNASNDDIISTESNQRKRQSIDTSLNNSTLPFATDLESLPGHEQNESRDKRFINYSDTNTLSTHFNTCLYIDKRSFSSSFLTRKHIFKTRHNILNKIFKLYHGKTYKTDEKLFQNKNEDIKANQSSASNSFKIDWSVNRRNSSSYRRDPKNMFHILQLNPKKDFSSKINNPESTQLSMKEQQKNHYEQVKEILVRTYYPHLHKAVEDEYYFGAKSKLQVKQHDLPIFTSVESPRDINETPTITLNSPPIINNEQEIKKRGRKSKHKTLKDKPLQLAFTERRVSEEIPPVDVQEPIVITTSTEISLSSPQSSITDNEIKHNIRKRKTSLTINTNIYEDRKRKRFNPSPSPELITGYKNVSFSESDDDTLPDQLPKQNFIKNGLRSNYYKTLTDTDSKSMNKNRTTRRRQHSSGSLPPFYTGMFESDDEKLSYIDYKLPFDIYWFSQKQESIINVTPTKPTNSPKKKKIAQPKPKQKQTTPHKKPIYKLNTNAIVERKVLSNIDDKKPQKIVNLPKLEELTEHEKQIVLQSAIFLKRNLRRIKEKQESKDKTNHHQKQHIEEQKVSLFFSQKYYHPNNIKQEDESDISHKDLLNLFYNYLRRSHFYKTSQYWLELVDPTCYYAQLAQLTIILDEIFDFLLNYKCLNSDIHPSNALKKCPLKRLFPMYYELILRPIDLTMIRNKLDNGEYLSYESFEQDLLLLFNNAVTYCGEDSDVGRAVKDLETYFLTRLKPDYQPILNLFNNINNTDKTQRNINILQDFITRLHKKETMNGLVRESLYDIIFSIDSSSPVVYKTILSNTTSANRTTKIALVNDCTVHCRCGSVYDETSLVQCYACQLWQHVSCVTILDSSRPYYCFECQPKCEEEPSLCLKTNILIPLPQSSTPVSNDNFPSYSTITRSDGLIVRINECYFVQKQEDNVSSTQYHIFSIERLWIDDTNKARATGFYYLRSYETFHEANRKFFSNELFRFPSVNDSIEINAIIRPCYVLDAATYCKGKPISEFTNRILPTDLFICEYRVDKLAKIFTRLPKSKYMGCNIKSYCFDNYVEKLSIKRDYQPHQKESHSQQTPRRRSTIHPMKLTSKQLDEKSSHIDGIIEKIYCRFHHPSLIPNETKFSPSQFLQQPTTDRNNNNRASKRLRDKTPSSSTMVNKKRRTQSISSNDYPNECILDNTQIIVSSLIDELIELISSHNV